MNPCLHIKFYQWTIDCFHMEMTLQFVFYYLWHIVNIKKYKYICGMPQFGVASSEKLPSTLITDFLSPKYDLYQLIVGTWNPNNQRSFWKRFHKLFANQLISFPWRVHSSNPWKILSIKYKRLVPVECFCCDIQIVVCTESYFHLEIFEVGYESYFQKS